MSARDDEKEISSLYANSENNAEKAEPGRDSKPPPKSAMGSKTSFTTPVPPEGSANASKRVGYTVGSGGGGDGDGVAKDDKEKKEFRDDAKIWRFYLDEAERKAKEQAVLWNTGLDSLLIFAGLFAGIVSSFVIDARRDLQMDSEQRVLGEIREAVLQGFVSPQEPITTASNWTSGLWMLSLYTTLFSAIMGVLAKAWLAKFIPSTTRREARDAYHRYKLDRQAVRWHLKEVLILIPLLVQIATFLFLVGLILQSHADNPTIGRTLLAFCISGGLVYFAMTIVPFFVPSSPFNTPLHELCGGLFSQDAEGTSPPKRDINDGLGDIFYNKLIKSPKPFHVDEAFAEVALQSFNDKWVSFLCKKDTSVVLLSRLRQCAMSRSENPTERNETLCNHLLALLKFANLYERNLPAEAPLRLTAPIPSGFDILDRVLRKSLKPGNPLHRWNELPEEVRPLVFGLRTQVLMLLPQGPATEGVNPTPIDFHDTELPDRPWDMALSDIRSDHRLLFMLGACRGLAQGRSNLKTISGYILCVSLAKATLTASETGRTSEWAASLGSQDRDKVERLASQYLSILYDATVRVWESSTPRALMVACNAKALSVDEDVTDPHAVVLRSLLFALSQTDHPLRIHAIKMLKYASTPNPTLFAGIVDASLKNIANMTVWDDQDVRSDGLDLLLGLSKGDSVMRGKINDALVASIQTGLATYESQPRMRTLLTLQTISGFTEDCFSPVIDAVIPNLVEVALDETTPDDIRSIALRLSQRLHNCNKAGVKEAVLKYLVAALDSEEYSRQIDILETTQNALKQQDYQENWPKRPSYAFPWIFARDFLDEVIPAMFEKIVKVAIHSETRQIYQQAQDILADISKTEGKFRPLTIDALGWINAATVLPSRWRVRHNGLLVLKIFAGWETGFSENEVLLKKLVDLSRHDDDDDVRNAALDLLITVLDEKTVPDGDAITERNFEVVRDAILALDLPPPVVIEAESPDEQKPNEDGDAGAAVNESPEEEAEQDSTKQAGSSTPSEPAPSPGDAISNEYYDSVVRKWVTLLGRVARKVSFSDAVVILSRLFLQSSDEQVRSSITGLFATEEFADPLYQAALAKFIPVASLNVKLPKEVDWYNPYRWLVYLVLLAKTQSQETVSKNSLAAVVLQMRSTIDAPLPAPEPTIQPETEDGTSSVNQESKADDESYLAEAVDFPPGLRLNLSKMPWTDRLYWVKMFAEIVDAFPTEFEEEPHLLLQLAIHDPDNDVRSSCIRGLMPPAKRDPGKVQEAMMKEWASGLSKLTGDSDWRIRFGLVQLLGVVGSLTDATLPEVVTDKIISMAMDDEDYDTRSESVNAMALLSKRQDGKYADMMKKALLTHFDKGIADGSRTVRISWINFAAPHVKDAEFTGLPKIIDAALKDPELEVQEAAASVLQNLLEDDKLRDSTATALGKALTSALKALDADEVERAVTILTRFTNPKVLKDFEGNKVSPDVEHVVQGHTLWVKIVALLGRNSNMPELPKLIEASLKDTPDTDDFWTLKPLFQKVKLSESIQSVLPLCVESALKLDMNSDIQSAAVDLLDRLIGNVDGRSRSSTNRYSELIHSTRDAQIIARLSDIVLKDSDPVLREQSLELLKAIFDDQRFQDLIKDSLSKSIEHALRDLEAQRFRANAITAIRNLTEAQNSSLDMDFEKYKEVVSPSIPYLVRMTVLASDKEHEQLRKDAEDILLQNLAASSIETKFNRDALAVIPTIVPTMTVEGRATAIQLTESLTISEETAASAAHALAPVLRNTSTSSFACETAIELLSKLYSRHWQSKPRMIESAIPEIIRLALDDKDDVGGIRTVAIRLLVALSSAPEGVNVSDHTSSTISATTNAVLKQITPLATRFMALLDNESIRPSVVELLSIMSTEAAVRRTISINIIQLFFGPESNSLVGHAELLGRLIADGRFGDEAIDHVMLLFASAMVTRPKLAAHRFQILTALWCRYGSNPFKVPNSTTPKLALRKELVDWFTFALFGRHATLHEVPTWLERCGPWLAASGTSEVELKP